MENETLTLESENFWDDQPDQEFIESERKKKIRHEQEFQEEQNRMEAINGFINSKFETVIDGQVRRV